MTIIPGIALIALFINNLLLRIISEDVPAPSRLPVRPRLQRFATPRARPNAVRGRDSLGAALVLPAAKDQQEQEQALKIWLC